MEQKYTIFPKFHIFPARCTAFFVLLQPNEIMSKNTNPTQIEIKNRKAEYQYFLLTSYTAGIVLTGTEIKSIRAGRANITDAYCSFVNNELWVHNMHVSEYANGSYNSRSATASCC